MTDKLPSPELKTNRLPALGAAGLGTVLAARVAPGVPAAPATLGVGLTGGGATSVPAAVSVGPAAGNEDCGGTTVVDGAQARHIRSKVRARVETTLHI